MSDEIKQEELDTNQTVDDYFKKLDEEHENRGHGMLTLYLLIAIIIFFLIGLWVGVYTFRSYQLDKELKNTEAMAPAEPEGLGIEAVYYVIDDTEYTAHDLFMLESVPTVLDVHVYYVDGTEMIKAAYVCSSEDVEGITYQDGTYGKVIFPQ